MNIKRFVFVLFSFFLFALGVGVIYKQDFLLWRKSMNPLYNPAPSKELPPLGTKFQVNWAEDIRFLIQTQQLPPQWDSLVEFKYYIQSDEMEDWEPEIIAPIPINPAGKYKMDVLIVPWQIEKVVAVLIQYDIYEAKSKNLIWELSRNVYLVGTEADIPEDKK